jgi:gluconolactonase
VPGLGFPNWPAFAPDGTLFVSDSGEWGANDGRMVRIDADGAVETFSRAVPHFTNGCAVTPDGRWLWVVESYVPLVSRLDLATGAREEVRRIDGTVLDGLAFTDDGGVLISCYRPDRIYHVDPDGGLEVVAQDPQGTLLAAPTNVCFVGDRVVAANFGRRHLTLLELGLRGGALHRPARWALDTVAVSA